MALAITKKMPKRKRSVVIVFIFLNESPHHPGAYIGVSMLGSPMHVIVLGTFNIYIGLGNL